MVTRRHLVVTAAAGGLLAVSLSGCAGEGATTIPLDRATGAVLADAAERLADALSADDPCRAISEADALRDRADRALELGDAPESVVEETIRVVDATTGGLACDEDDEDEDDGGDESDEGDRPDADDEDDVDAGSSDPVPADPGSDGDTSSGTTSGTTSSGQTSSGDTSSGDTSSGDTGSGDDTSNGGGGPSGDGPPGQSRDGGGPPEDRPGRGGGRG